MSNSEGNMETNYIILAEIHFEGIKYYFEDKFQFFLSNCQIGKDNV